jgi:hypothetical protein
MSEQRSFLRVWEGDRFLSKKTIHFDFPQVQ